MKFINNAEADCNNVTFLKIEIDGKIKEYKSQLKEYFQLLDVLIKKISSQTLTNFMFPMKRARLNSLL